MRRADLERLRGPRGYPAVSLLAPLQRHRPGNAEDPVRLRHLTKQARDRLEDELGVRGAASVLRHLEDGVASIDLGHPPDAVAVFATATETQVLALIEMGLMPLVSFKDSDRVRLAGFRAINGDELALA